MKYLRIIAGKKLGVSTVHVWLVDKATGQDTFKERLVLVVEDDELQVIASSNERSLVEGVTLSLSDLRLEVMSGPLDKGQRYLRSILRAYWAKEIAWYFELLRNEQLKAVPRLERKHFRTACSETGEFKLLTDQGYLVVSRHLYPEQPSEAGYYFRLESAPAEHPIRTASGGAEVVVGYPGGQLCKKLVPGTKSAILAEELGKVILPVAARQRQPVTVW